MSLSLVGCSSKKSISSDAAATNNTDRSDTGSGTTGSSTTPPNDSDWGAMGYLDIVDTDAFEEFSGYTVEDLLNERIYIKLNRFEHGSSTYYEGDVRIAYDYQYIHNQYSSTPGVIETVYKHPRFEAKAYDDDELDENPNHLKYSYQGVRFNKFIMNDGKQYFVGFFEEPDFYDWSPWGWDPAAKAGALMIIIDDLDDDGFSGSVWFHNYDFTYAVKPVETRCTDIEIGPYSCRDFVVNDEIRPDLDITPNTFTKLGEFYNLDVAEAFDN